MIKKKYIWSLLIFAISLQASNYEKFVQELISNSFERNPSILSKKNAITSASYSVDGARWQYFPTPSLRAENDDSGERVVTFGLQQPLWAGGKIDATYDKTKIQAQIAKMNLNETKESLAILITQNIYNLLSSYGKTLVYADALRRLEEHKNMITRRIKEGASPDSELLLIDARLSQAKTDYSMSLALENKTLVTLDQLLAKKVTIEEFRDILPKELNKLELTSKYSDEELMNKVIEVNPSLEKYSEQIKAQSYEVDIKKAVLYPTVYAKYEKNWLDNNNTNSNNNDSLFKIGVEYSPGAGLSSLSAIDSAKADLLTLSRDRENMELELRQKIDSELSDYEFTYNRYENYTLAVESNQQTQESYKRLFIAGKRSWLDVLNAERELINAQISLSDVQAYLVTTPIKFKIFSNELLKLEKANNEY